MSEQESGGSEYNERRERNFKHDFAMAMWWDLPDDAKERLRDAHSTESASERGGSDAE